MEHTRNDNLFFTYLHNYRYCLYIALFIQILAYIYSSFVHGSSFHGIFFHYVGFNDVLATMFERAILSTMLMLAPLIWLHKTRPVLLFFFIIFFVDSFFSSIVYSDPIHALNWIGAGIRWGLPLALFFIGRTHLRFSHRGLVVLKLTLFLTFIGHGEKCLEGHPLFIDYILYFFNEFLSFNISESQALAICRLIGLVDVIAAAIGLVTRFKFVFYYLAFWGAATAIYRIIYLGTGGVDAFLVRSAHFLVPIYLIFLFRKEESIVKRLSTLWKNQDFLNGGTQEGP